MNGKAGKLTLSYSKMWPFLSHCCLDVVFVVFGLSSFCLGPFLPSSIVSVFDLVDTSANEPFATAWFFSIVCGTVVNIFVDWSVREEIWLRLKKNLNFALSRCW